MGRSVTYHILELLLADILRGMHDPHLLQVPYIGSEVLS